MSEDNNKQTFPTVDSPVNDAFEGIVELYYQINGYITSTGKWFYKWDKENKSQRGYQDIDVLAINSNETLIISVSSNFDDKISFKRSGDFNHEQFNDLIIFYDRVEEYLKNTQDYLWLAEKSGLNPREVKRVLAVINKPSQKQIGKLDKVFEEKNIDIQIIGIDDMFESIYKYFNINKNIKTQNESFRLLQILFNKRALLEKILKESVE